MLVGTTAAVHPSRTQSAQKRIAGFVSRPGGAHFNACCCCCEHLAAVSNGLPSTTVYHLLQGKWQSTLDEQSFIELRDHLYIDSYAGEAVDTTEFVLAKSCVADSNTGHSGDNERYLVQPKEKMCWEIVSVDEESLELSYTTRGNTLTYRKVK